MPAEAGIQDVPAQFRKRFLDSPSTSLRVVSPSTMLRTVSPSTMLRTVSLSNGLSNGLSNHRLRGNDKGVMKKTSRLLRYIEAT
jgi:hypothetical protein